MASTSRPLSVLARRIARHPVAFIVVPVLLCLASVPTALGVTERLSTGGWLPADSESVAIEEVLDHEFDRNTTSHFILFSDPTAVLAATDTEFRREVARTVAPLYRDPDVLTIYTWGSTQNDVLNRTLLSDDRSMSLAVVVTRQTDDTTRTFERIEAEITNDRLDVQVGGWAATASAFQSMTRSDLLHAEKLAIPATLVLLVVIFGGIVAGVLPVALAVLALLPTLAIVAGMSHIMETSLFAVNIVSMLGLALGIDYALILVSRFREESARNDDRKAVLTAAMATAGETIVVSATAVLLGMVGLVTFGVPAAVSTAVAAGIVVLLCATLALTALPAALVLLGNRVLTRSFRLPGMPRWHLPIRTHPVIAIAITLIVIGVLTAPAFQMRGAASSMTLLPQTQEARQVYDTVDARFPNATLSPIVVVVTPVRGSMTSVENLRSLLDFQNRVDDLDGVASIQSLWSFLPVGVTPTVVASTLVLDATMSETVRPYLTDEAAIFEITPLDGPSDAGALTLVRTLRADARALSEGAFTIQVGAEVATNVDLIDYVQDRAPWTVAIVVALTWLALYVRFRSVLIPTKAVILNLLSLGASFGMLVWIFQHGHLEWLLRFEPLDYTILLIPIIMFCFMFGLSMDYEVVMLSRIHESWRATGDNARAVDDGLQASAGIVTSAALIMLVVFIAFATGELPFVKQIGVGLALAVMIDTTAIRLILLPSTMRIAGRWNWWRPGVRG